MVRDENITGPIETEEDTEVTGPLDVDMSDDALSQADDTQQTTVMQPVASEPVRASSMRPVVQVPTESVQSTFQRNESRIHHGIAASFITVLAFLLIGLGSGMFYRHVQSERDTAAILAENEQKALQMKQERERAEVEAEEQRALEEARALRKIKFIVNAIEYDATATRLPLVVTGIDFEGNEIHEEVFVNAAGEGLALPPGEYAMTVAASPVKADGSMYTIPSTTFNFKVPQDKTGTVHVDQAIVLSPVPKDKVTSDMLNNAYTWAVKDTENTNLVDTNFATLRAEVEANEARRREQDKQTQLNDTRKALAESFASSFFTNISFPNTKDDSQILVITNWSAIAGQYVAPNSAAQKKLAAGPDPEDDYTFAISVKATNVSGDTVTVECSVVATSKPTNGWTKDTYPAVMRITFDANNKITSFSID